MSSMWNYFEKCRQKLFSAPQNIKRLVKPQVRNGGDTAKETLPDGRIVQFHDLQSNIPEVKADKELYTVFKKVQKVLTEMMKEKCPSEEDLMELYGKIVVNCHQPYIGQFGCGNLKMVGPKMQDFCLRIDMLKRNYSKTILQ